MTQLEVLSLYFAHGVEVETREKLFQKPDEVSRGKLVTIDLPSGTVRVAESASVAPPKWFAPDEVKPVLYDFADLATPLTLADGTVVVPAVEVAKMLFHKDFGKCSVLEFSAEIEVARPNYHPNVGHIMARGKGTFLELREDPKGQLYDSHQPWLEISPSYSFRSSFSYDKSQILRVYDYLRRLHFAVGLPADSWVRKEVTRA